MLRKWLVKMMSVTYTESGPQNLTGPIFTLPHIVKKKKKTRYESGHGPTSSNRVSQTKKALVHLTRDPHNRPFWHAFSPTLMLYVKFAVITAVPTLSRYGRSIKTRSSCRFLSFFNLSPPYFSPTILFLPIITCHPAKIHSFYFM